MLKTGTQSKNNYFSLRKAAFFFFKKVSIFTSSQLFHRYYSLFFFFNGEYCQGRKPDDKTKGTFSGSVTKHNFHG